MLGESEVIVVGSQAILGAQYEGLPKDVTLSVEVDVMATHDPDGSKALHLNGGADASLIAGCPSTRSPRRQLEASFRRIICILGLSAGVGRVPP